VGRRWRNLSVGCLAAAGCGQADRPAPVAVRGAVTFQGRPLAGGVVVFAPDADRGTPGRPLSTAVGYHGEYQFADAQKVPPGWYRVALADAPQANGGPSGFPAALRRPDRSGLSREVRPGGENVLDFSVELPD
jgi:hypothetical protein